MPTGSPEGSLPVLAVQAVGDRDHAHEEAGLARVEHRREAGAVLPSV